MNICSKLNVFLPFLVSENLAAGIRNAVRHSRGLVEIAMSNCVIRALWRWTTVFPYTRASLF